MESDDAKFAAFESELKKDGRIHITISKSSEEEPLKDVVDDLREDFKQRGIEISVRCVEVNVDGDPKQIKLLIATTKEGLSETGLRFKDEDTESDDTETQEELTPEKVAAACREILEEVLKDRKFDKQYCEDVYLDIMDDSETAEEAIGVAISALIDVGIENPSELLERKGILDRE